MLIASLSEFVGVSFHAKSLYLLSFFVQLLLACLQLQLKRVVCTCLSSDLIVAALNFLIGVNVTLPKLPVRVLELADL